MIVADASPVIALSKIGRLDILRDLYGQVLVSPGVRTEVLGRTEHARAEEVAPVRAGVTAGWIREGRLTTNERRVVELISQDFRVHRGEAESIAMAVSRRLQLIVDDKEARAIAAANGVAFLGTAAVLLDGYRRDIYGFEALEGAVRDLGRVIWLSPAVVAEILRRAREIRR